MAERFAKTATLPATNCDRDDFYDLIETLDPTSALVDDVSLGVTGAQLYTKSWVPRWYKYSFTYANFTAAGLSESITVLALAAAETIHATVVDVTTAWVIGGMSTLDLELGIAADPDKYSGSTHVGGEAISRGKAFSAPANAWLESMTAATNLLLKATSDVGNLSTATAGAVDIYVLKAGLVNV